MTINECVIKAAKYLGLDDLALAFEFTDSEQQQEAVFSEMARDVIREICTDYYPLIKKETIDIPSDGAFLFKALSEVPLDIYSVNKNGISFPFVLRYNRFEAAISGECEIEYSFMPEITADTSKLPFPDKIDARIIAFGIAAEYCIRNGLDDAVIWDKRYKDALNKALRAKGEKRLKSREWR